MNYRHGVPNARSRHWRRSRERAIQKAQSYFQNRVEKELKDLFETYKLHYPLDKDLSIECYWDRKDGTSPPAKAQEHAEREAVKRNRAGKAEDLLQELRDFASDHDRHLPNRLGMIKKFASKADSLFGNALSYGPQSWSSAFSSGSSSNFVEKGLAGMKFATTDFKIRHILCLDEADLSIARRADYLRVQNKNHSLNCFISSDSDLLFLSEPEDLFVRSLKGMSSYQALDRKKLDSLEGWVNTEKQRVLGLVVGHDYTGRGLLNIGLKTAIPLLKSLPAQARTPRQVQHNDPFPTPGERRMKDSAIFNQLLKAISNDDDLSGRVEWQDRRSLDRITNF